MIRTTTTTTTRTTTTITTTTTTTTQTRITIKTKIITTKTIVTLLINDVHESIATTGSTNRATLFAFARLCFSRVTMFRLSMTYKRSRLAENVRYQRSTCHQNCQLNECLLLIAYFLLFSFFFLSSFFFFYQLPNAIS